MHWSAYVFFFIMDSKKGPNKTKSDPFLLHSYIAENIFQLTCKIYRMHEGLGAVQFRAYIQILQQLIVFENLDAG